MPYSTTIGVIAVIALVIGLWSLYAWLWYRQLDALADRLGTPEAFGMVIWTDKLFPRLGKMPSQSSRWRMRQSMLWTRHGMVTTYKPSPDAVGIEDLDDIEVVDSEMRALEAHGRSLANDNKPEEDASRAV